MVYDVQKKQTEGDPDERSTWPACQLKRAAATSKKKQMKPRASRNQEGTERSFIYPTDCAGARVPASQLAQTTERAAPRD